MSRIQPRDERAPAYIPDGPFTPHADLPQAFERSRQRVLACWLLERSGISLRLGYMAISPNLTGAIAVGTALLLLLTAATWLEGGDVPRIAAAIVLASLTTSLGLYSVTRLFAYTTAELETSFNSRLSSEGARRSIIAWIEFVTDPRKQRIAVVIMAVLAVAVTALLQAQRVRPFPIYVSTYLAMVAAGIGLGQGVYLAVLVPTSAVVLARLDPADLRTYKLNPSRTPLLAGYARLMNAYARASALSTTLALATIIALRPIWTATATWALLGVLFLGYVITSYVFIVPHLVLSSVIRREKARALAEVQVVVSAMWERALSGDLEAGQSFERLRRFADEIYQSRSSLVDIAGIRAYAASLAVPTLTLIAGRINWIALLRKAGLPI